jgi:CheY-like chemotaxis protein
VGGSETVLVVEDNTQLRQVTVRQLTELGYRVLQAERADAALAILAEDARIDLLFTDVVMPGALKSPELSRRAREWLPGLAVLFTSGYTQSAIVHGGRLDEGVELLPKPYTQAELASRIRAVLADRADRSERAQRSERRAGGRSAANDLRPVLAPLSILLVEDDALVRESTAEMLKDLGHTVYEAPSAEAAMALLADESADVLITDIGLPGLSGDVFAAEARSLRPKLRIVFATGNDRIADVGGNGANPVLLRKPYDSVAIEAALRAAHS